MLPHNRILSLKYYIIIVLLLSIPRINGLLPNFVKVNLSRPDMTFNLNEKVSFTSQSDIRICNNNTPGKFINQDGKTVCYININCDSYYSGNFIIPSNILKENEQMNIFKFYWNNDNNIIVESQYFKVLKKKNSRNNNLTKTLKNTSNAVNPQGIRKGLPKGSVITITTTKPLMTTIKQSKETIINDEDTKIIMNDDIKYNKTSTNYDSTSVKPVNASNNNRNGRRLVNKIMLVIIIFLIGCITVISVKLIKTKNRNKIRRKRINEMKFPQLRINPLESESFLNINNSNNSNNSGTSLSDMFDSSKMTSLYLSSDESIGRFDNSNATYPIQKKHNDYNAGFKSILSSP